MIIILKFRKKSVLFLAFILVVPLFFATSVNAQAITISPMELYVSGELGNLEIVPISITNNDVSNAIVVTISYNGENVAYIPNPVMDIPANSTRYINIGFIISVEEVSWMTYVVDSVQYNQLVVIEIDKITPSVIVFPSKPKPGSNIAFLGDDALNAHGFIFFSDSGSTYPFLITDGIGFVELDINETGSAMARIVGDGFNPVYVNFTISGSTPPNPTDPDPPVDPDPPTDSFSIVAPESVLILSKEDVTVYKNTDPLSDFEILVTKPDGDTDESNTNFFGSVSITFDIVGNWKFTIITDNGLVSKETNCYKDTEEIVLKTDEPLVEQTVTLGVFDDANVIVSGPSNYKAEGSEAYGEFSFTPEVVGSYTANAESDIAKGDLTFDVYEMPRIIITDIKGRPLTKAKVDTTLFIRVVDHNNDDIVDSTILKIQDSTSPFSIPIDLKMRDGQANWFPITKGDFIIDFDGSGYYSEVMKTFIVEEEVFWLFTDTSLWILAFVGIIGSVIFVKKTKRGRFLSAWVKQKAGSKPNDDKTEYKEPT